MTRNHSRKVKTRVNRHKGTPSTQSHMPLSDVNWEISAVVGTALIAAGFGASSYLSPASVARRDNNEAFKIASSQHELSMELSEQASTKSKAIADERLTGACDLMAKEIGDKRFAALPLTKDTVFHDPLTGNLLAPTTPVCDDNGMTALVDENGQAYDFHRSYNPVLINARVDDAFGWAKEFIRSNPESTAIATESAEVVVNGESE